MGRPSPEQELSRNNPASLLKVLELAEITIAEAGLTLSAGRDEEGRLEPLAQVAANHEDVLRELIEGLDAPFQIDWHEDAVIVTVAVVKPKCQDVAYRKHCGQVLGEMKLPPALTQQSEHAYLTDPTELWTQMDRGPRPDH